MLPQITLPFIYLGTINVSGKLPSTSGFTELCESIKTYKFDIIGVSETRLRGEYSENIKDFDYVLYSCGVQEKHHAGTGFFVKTTVIPYLTQCVMVSNRLSFIDIEVNGRTLRILQAYAPCSNYNDDVNEEFLENVRQVLDGNLPMGAKKTPKRFTKVIIMGDLNARVGSRDADEKYIGPYGYGIRNPRGELLLDFCTEKRLFIADSFKKKRPSKRWTFQTRNRSHRSKIDYFLTQDLNMINNIEVVHRFDFHSDHQFLMAKVKMDNMKMKWRPKRGPKKRVDPIKFNDLLNVEVNREANSSIVYESLMTSIDEAMTQAKVDVPKPPTLSIAAQNLFAERRALKGNHPHLILELSIINKLLRLQLQMDEEERAVSYVERAIRENTSLRGARIELIKRRKRFHKLVDEQGNIQYTKQGMNTVVKNTFEKIYKSAVNVPFVFIPSAEPFPEFLPKEVDGVITEMRGRTAPGPDKVNIDLIKAAKSQLVPVLTDLFNKCVNEGTVPDKLGDSVTTLLFKSGDPKDINNYRPISLLSSVLKLFTKVITKRMQQTLTEAQTVEQAGFRKQYSTIDHLFTLGQILQVSNEYNLPLYLMFVDYRKAFDSLEHGAVWRAIQQQGVHSSLIQVVREIYRKGRSSVLVNEERVPIDIERGVRQGDTLSPILFTSCLRWVFGQIDWEEKGLSINGRYMSHLAFADDIVLVATSRQELILMANELVAKSSEVGLSINVKKTVAMCTTPNEPPIVIQGGNIDFVEKFKYLGQMVSIPSQPQAELSRRISAGWNVFSAHHKFLTSKKVAMQHKRKLFNMCILPAMTYGCETWALTKRLKAKLAIAQRKMERRMLGVTVLDRKTNSWLRNATKLIDITSYTTKRKFNWALKISRLPIERWSRAILDWLPYNGKRERGRPAKRWRDDIVLICGTQWQQISNDLTRYNEWSVFSAHACDLFHSEAQATNE